MSNSSATGADRIVTLPVTSLPIGPTEPIANNAPASPSQRVVRMHVSEEWLSQYRSDPAAPILTVAPTPLLSPSASEAAARSAPQPMGPPIVGFHLHGQLPRKSISAPNGSAASPRAVPTTPAGGKSSSSGASSVSSSTGASNGTSSVSGTSSATNGVMLEMTTPPLPSTSSAAAATTAPKVHTKLEVEEKEEAQEGKRRGVSRRPTDWKQAPRAEKTLNYLIKFGRRGRPKEKLVVFDCTRGLVSWRDPNQAKCSGRQTIKVILLKEITDIRKGKSTPAFHRSQTAAKKADDNCCISVFTSTRSLSLMAPNEEDRNGWFDKLCDAYVADRAQSNQSVARPLGAQLAGVMGTLDGDVRKTWTRGMRGAPAYMIAKDFHRLAHNFGVYTSERDPPVPVTASTTEKEKKDAVNGGAGMWSRVEPSGASSPSSVSAPPPTPHRVEETKTADTKPVKSIIASSPTAADVNRRRIDDCQQRAGSAHNVKAVMSALTRALLSEEKAAILMESLERHQAGVAAGQRENDRMLEAFFEENYGSSGVHGSAALTAGASADAAGSTSCVRADITVPERGILAILKLCNQNVLFPAVNVLKRTVLPTYGTRDYRGGWRIGIEISPSQVSVVHKKRELSEAGKFSFTWELRLVLDRTDFTHLIRVELSVLEATFYDDCPAAARADVATRLLTLSQQSEIAVANQRSVEANVMSCFDERIVTAAVSPAVASSTAATAPAPATGASTGSIVPSSAAVATATPPAAAVVTANGEASSSSSPVAAAAASSAPPSFATIINGVNGDTSPSATAAAASAAPAPAAAAAAAAAPSSNVVHLNSSLFLPSSFDDEPSPKPAPSSGAAAPPSFEMVQNTNSIPAPPPSFDTVHVA